MTKRKASADCKGRLGVRAQARRRGRLGVPHMGQAGSEAGLMASAGRAESPLWPAVRVDRPREKQLFFMGEANPPPTCS